VVIWHGLESGIGTEVIGCITGEQIWILSLVPDSPGEIYRERTCAPMMTLGDGPSSWSWAGQLIQDFRECHNRKGLRCCYHDKHRWFSALTKSSACWRSTYQLLSGRWLIVWVTSTRSMCWGFWYRGACIQLQSGQPQSILLSPSRNVHVVEFAFQYYVAMAHSFGSRLQIAIWRPENFHPWYQSQTT